MNAAMIQACNHVGLAHIQISWQRGRLWMDVAGIYGYGVSSIAQKSLSQKLSKETGAQIKNQIGRFWGANIMRRNCPGSEFEMILAHRMDDICEKMKAQIKNQTGIGSRSLR